MIDEQALHALGDDRGPDIPCRPVDPVIARGTRLRGRRRAVRTAGAGAVAVCLVGTGLLVRRQEPGDESDVQAADDSTTATSDVPSSPPPPPPDCASENASEDGLTLIPPEELAAADVADELRVLPGWTPEATPITVARGNRWTNLCPDTAPYPVDDSLLLHTDGAEDPWIRLSGPLPRPLSDQVGISLGISQEPTELRGGAAILWDPGTGDDVAFAWTAPDGWSWDLAGYDVDEPTLRAVAEALVLDSSPEGDEPVAALAPGDVPEGFEITWQTLGVPTPLDPVSTSWTVQVGGANEGGVQVGISCHLEVRPRVGDIPFGVPGGSDDDPVTVNGQDAYWGSSPAGPLTALWWQLGPDVVATAGCLDWDAEGDRMLPNETIVQFAESVVPAPADDPRLPG